MNEPKSVAVMYVGLKDKETDRKAGTGLTWVGKGDVQMVTEKQWEVLSRHPDVWARVEADAPAAPSSDAGPTLGDAPKPAEHAADPDLYTMNTAALREYAKARGLQVDMTLKGQALRDAIKGLT